MGVFPLQSSVAVMVPEGEVMAVPLQHERSCAVQSQRKLVISQDPASLATYSAQSSSLHRNEEPLSKEKGSKKTKNSCCLPHRFNQGYLLGLLSNAIIQKWLEVILACEVSICTVKSSSREWTRPMCEHILCVLHLHETFFLVLCCPEW